MDISTRTSTFVSGDQSWLGNGGKPIGENRTIVLDVSAFTVEDGRIPSGTAIGRDADTGMYVPFEAATGGDDPTPGTGEAGYLFTDAVVDPSSSGDLGAALFWSGEVIVVNLPEEPPAGFVEATANHIAHI